MAFWGEWGRYVPVAERRAKARREMDKLRKKGKDIQPVNLDGRTIARSFWAKGGAIIWNPFPTTPTACHAGGPTSATVPSAI